MPKWEEFGIEQKVQGILDQQKYGIPNHHLGRPFLSAYQIAIEFALQFPEEFRRLDMPIGGKDLGEHHSFAQYLGRELSRISRDPKSTIQGGFLSNTRLKDIQFDSGTKVIHSSLTGSQFDLSLFRSTRPIRPQDIALDK